MELQLIPGYLFMLLIIGVFVYACGVVIKESVNGFSPARLERKNQEVFEAQKRLSKTIWFLFPLATWIAAAAWNLSNQRMASLGAVDEQLKETILSNFLWCVWFALPGFFIATAINISRMSKMAQSQAIIELNRRVRELSDENQDIKAKLTLLTNQ